MMSSNNWVGKTLGKVQIESLLARGGMAEVYLGTHITLHRKVAVKILRNPSEEHSDALERFQREARVVAGLRHANIVQVYDFDMVDNDPYLVMEYIQGPSLSKYLHYLHQANKKLELPQIVRLIKGLASALQYAHKNGIIHRDIKPGNILLISPTSDIEVDKPLPDDFEPVLTDFGLIRFIDSARQTTTGVTAGTPAYMSPEQARGETTDGRTDVYSLGIVLYEMLAGKLPFDGETTMGILLKHVNEPPASIPGLSPFMQKVLDRVLAKDVNVRFQTPMEFANAFSASVDIHPGTMQMESIGSLGPSTMELQNVAGGTNGEKVHLKRSRWIQIAIAGVILAAIGSLFLINGFPFSPTATTTQTIPPSFTAEVAATNTFISTATPAPIILEPSLTLHFQDGNAVADQVQLVAYRIPAAPEGNRYEAWLVNKGKRLGIGILVLDEAGMGKLTYTDPAGANLAALYDQADITVEPAEDTKPASSGIVSYTFTLPAQGLVNLRYLLVSYPTSPDKAALIQGLFTSVKKIDQFATDLQKATNEGNYPLARQKAEGILNLIAGSQSSNYKDWDKDGFVTDESDGYGLILNGSSPGYLQLVYSETSTIIKYATASEPMTTHGGILLISVQNLAQWTNQIQELATDIIQTPDQKNSADLLKLADQMLNGADLNQNGTIEPIAGEIGVQGAYENAYWMADMPLYNTSIGTPTPLGGGAGGGTPTGSGGGGGGSTAPTKVPPGQIKKTEKPPNPNKP